MPLTVVVEVYHGEVWVCVFGMGLLRGNRLLIISQLRLVAVWFSYYHVHRVLWMLWDARIRVSSLQDLAGNWISIHIHSEIVRGLRIQVGAAFFKVVR